MYGEKGKSELIITIDLEILKIEEVWKSLIDIIKEASDASTGIKNHPQRLKKNKKQDRLEMEQLKL